jgi:hypothetical protein
MRKAWIKGGFVQDICPAEFDPIFAYGEEIGSNYVTDVPDDVGNGWQLNEHGTWVAPNFAAPPEPTPIPAPAAPTKEELLAQLQAIQAQIQAL